MKGPETMTNMSPWTNNSLRDAIAHPNFLLVRTRRVGGTAVISGSCGIIHRDSTSPSGKVQVAEGSLVEATALVRELRGTSPVSPTEGLGV